VIHELSYSDWALELTPASMFEYFLSVKVAFKPFFDLIGQFQYLYY